MALLRRGKAHRYIILLRTLAEFPGKDLTNRAGIVNEQSKFGCVRKQKYGLRSAA